MKKMLYALLIATPLCAMDQNNMMMKDSLRRDAKRVAIFTGIHVLNSGPMYAAAFICPPLTAPALVYSALKIGGELMATEAVMYATENNRSFQDTKK